MLRKISRAIVKYCGLGFAVSGAAFHFLIGSLSYWTAYLSPILGREQTINTVTDYYDLFVPRRTVVFHIITWQIILAGIPDIRQIMGAQPATIDYMMSQSSGNVSVLIWLTACFLMAKSARTDIEE